MVLLGQGTTRIPVRSLWFLLIYASGLLDQLRSTERDQILAGERDDDLIDAIAEVLVAEVEDRLRRELTVQYHGRQADLHRVRGRIDHLRTTTRRLYDQGRIACRFDELSVDSPRNRFIAHTLLWAAPLIARNDLAQRCRVAAFRMHRLGVNASAPSKAELSTDRLGRHDAGDRRMLGAAHLLRDMVIPVQDPGQVDLVLLRNDAAAHRKLFEHAVRGFFRHHLGTKGWSVATRILKWTPPGEPAPPFLPVMRTDITLDDLANQQRIVVETKFTDALVDRDGKSAIATGYLYQLYAYLATQSGRGDAAADSADGVLLFAQTVDREPFTAEFTIQDHRIRFLSVDLSALAADIRTRWLECCP